jgi:anti-sigma factor RsiW
MAAGLVMAFGAGWVGHAVWPQAGLNSALWSSMARTDIERSFVRQASLAHSVYTPEIKHPVEVTAQEQAHLVQWLSKRLGRPLKVPALTAQGFELVGGRLLPGDSGARAQFMFQNASGSRITLYLGAVDVMPGNTASKETSFRYELQSGVPSFYWVDQGFGYALSGQVPRDVLMTLAEAVYGQL